MSLTVDKKTALRCSAKQATADWYWLQYSDTVINKQTHKTEKAYKHEIYGYLKTIELSSE